MNESIRPRNRTRRATLVTLALAVALLVGCSPSPEPTRNPGPVATPTTPVATLIPTPLATPTPIPTPTPTPVPTPTLVPTPSAPATTTALTQRYVLAVKLDVAAHQLDVVETLIVTNKASRPINYLNLSVIPAALGYYAPRGDVTINGLAVTAKFTNHTNLRVEFGRDLAPGEAATVVVPFRLTVKASAGAFGVRTTYAGGILNLGEWFPILSREHDAYGLGDPQVSFAAESIILDLTTTKKFARDALAAAGSLKSFDGGNHWVYEIANARDYAFAFSTSFKLARATVGKIDVRLYYVSAAPKAALAAITAALRQYNTSYGTYPWPTFVMAETGAKGFSMEFPGLVLMGKNMFAGSLGRYVIWHEVAHQWWYGQVGNDQIEQPLVDEAMAEFSTRYFLGMGFTTCSKTAVDEPVTYWKAGLTTGDWFGCSSYFETIYRRGARFFNAIRSEMGATTFFRTLKTFVADERYQVVTSTDLLRALNAASGNKLGSIYRAYLTKSGAAAALR